MSQPAGDGGVADGGWKTGQHLQEKVGGASCRQGWTRAGCSCCASQQVEPLVVVKLGEKVGPETKRWLLRLIGAPQKDGGCLSPTPA